MIESIKMTLTNYFDFKGKSTRSEFWKFTAKMRYRVLRIIIIVGFSYAYLEWWQ